MPSFGRLGKILLGLAVSAGLLVYFFWDVDLRVVGARLRETPRTDPALRAGPRALSPCLRARAWYHLLRPAAPPSHLFRALMIGYMGNTLLPLRAGELVRVYVVTRRGQRFGTAFAPVGVERVLDGLSVGLIVAALLLVVPVPASVRWSIVVFLLADLAGIVVLVAIAAPPAARPRLS